MEPTVTPRPGEYLPGQPPQPPGRRGARWGESLRSVADRMPLRAKLITTVLALVIMALAAMSICTVSVLRSYLTSQYDSQLTATYQGIFAGLPRNFADHETGIAYPVGSQPNAYAGIQLPGDQLSPLSRPSGPTFPSGGGQRAPQRSVPDVPTTVAWATANAGKLLTLGSQSGRDTWRVIVTPVTVPLGSGSNAAGTLVVAWDLGNIDREVRWLITVDLLVSGAIVVILAIVTIAVVRASLRPLNDMELTAGQIAAGHLDHRIPERDPRTEVGSLGRSLNTMLSQIEAAFHDREQSEQAAHRSEERMRRFIADASHELRTPLTTIRGFAEYYRQRGGAGKIQASSSRTPPASPPASATSASAPTGLTPGELDRIMSRLESEAARMGLLVEDLLQLARLDQQRPMEMRPVDLLTLAADAVQDARLVAPDRGIELTVAPGAAFLVSGDEQRLRQVIANLVNNALTHTPAGTSVRVAIRSGTLKSGGPAVVLDVIDDGPGMTAEQAQRVFERFYRADAARNRSSGGTGLGLAIVAGLVQAHGGQVSVKTAPGEGADFRVKLPLSPDAVAAGDLSADDEAGEAPFGEDPAGDALEGHPAPRGG